jgi:Ca-activated chloride channel family protein
MIERQSGGGGTELLPALKRALALPKKDNVARTVVIATDGYVSVEEEAFDLIRNNLHNANMFAFGIGTSVNRHIIEGMAHVGMGESFIITNPNAAQTQANKFRKLIESPVLTHVKVAFNGFDTYDVEPLSIPDVLADRPVLVFGKWRGKPQGAIKLSGIAGNGEYSKIIRVAGYSPSENNAALKYLWARHRITILSDYNNLRNDDKRVKEVTRLGLNYNLLTAYTSFVAVDNDVRNRDGKITTVKQPLPLPEGVSDYAVGGQANYAAAPLKEKGLGMVFKSEKYAVANKPAAEELQAPRTRQDKDEAGKVNIVSVTTGKDSTDNEFLKVARARQSEIEKCFAGNTLRGTFTLSLTINPDGTVKTAEIAAGKIRDTKLRRCMISQIKQWRFPRSANGKAIKATITFEI